ncbi:D-methionine transport system substrate-binding protein [Aerococcus sp. 150760007-1]|uniref:Methionine ABC transporter substrate-binding protein n=2 Tax=Aerococcus TaxID=1375 RepID=A0A2J9PMY8_9LACT|nr:MULTISPECIES: MetQ/NlpA family ABC transporter substrate-binding protein [Lactobacillales]KAF3301985.1 MetQ/NlpA family ABC transporter substrate-binding protein [Carnobacterium sp. PL17RED31]KAF3301746.1 MetQ/NlpA family ABC transporter substrate-binding protein [Carnobacterium sp. PL12RED10]MBA5747371.1 MetQ/NlpA family ABC transporter substrate-binding protein [Aerococcus urinaeequi]MBA5830156.1 MetQ/NlpA family ABC transporter substrate-binding protein [Aerococcus urinaeequi]MBA5861058.
MKKIFRALGLALVVLVLAACGQSEETTKVKLGVVGDKNDQWEYLQEELLEKENIEIELVKFTDYRQPIVSLDDGSIDMHSALTEIYMDSINEEGGYSNTTLGYTTLNPMGVFSEKIDSLDELQDGALVAIPDDVSNGSRALLLLQTAGLIELDESKGLLPTTSDITSNPKNLQFEEMAANQTARALADVDISLINNDMATDAGYVPTQDSIYLEPVAESSKPYYNVIAVREDETDNEVYKTILEYYQTDEVAAIIDEMSAGSSIPVWEGAPTAE